jgi:hypothetical protein
MNRLILLTAWLIIALTTAAQTGIPVPEMT